VSGADTAPAALAQVLPDWLGDVAIGLGPVPGALAGETNSGVLWSAAPGRFWLDVPGVARYLAQEGRSLTIEPAPDADPRTVVQFARAAPLAAVCYQRGMAVLHAATAVLDGEAVLLAGASAAGKSTLLAALLARGWSMLGDEVAPLAQPDAGAVAVLPTGDDLRLWPDAVAALEPDPRLRQSLAGDARSPGPQTWTADHALDAPAPIAGIWWLTQHNRPGLEINAVEGLQQFESLGQLAYHGRVARTLLDRVAYLRIAATISSSVPLRHARRPRSAWTVEELADAIEQQRAERSEGVR
jgi:hypothetical protein